ncbi:hypothetical protein RI367_000371 [Sorochytrium milnesiophthora]
MLNAPAPLSIASIPQGKCTHTIYSLLRDQRYLDVARLLNNELASTSNSRNRPALSLLAYCYHNLNDWLGAAGWYDALFYEQLVNFFPEVQDYKLYYAQSLYKAGQHQMALKACQAIDDPQYAAKSMKLQAAIKYEMSDLLGCKALVDQCDPDDVDTIINQACLLFKDNKFEQALLKYTDASKRAGYQPEISYQIALCHFRLGQFVPSLKQLAEIIERGIRDYPELNVGMSVKDDMDSDGDLVQSALSSTHAQALTRSFLIEAFNLKAAIEYNLKNYAAAKEALQDMPPRMEEELDPVTLHNQALVYMEDDPSTGFEKLIFLLQQIPCPPETFGNLLLLYVKFDYYDAAADLLAENVMAARSVLNQYLYEFLEAILLKVTSPDEAFKRLEEIGNRQIDVLRKLTKQVQEARQNHDDDAVKRLVHDYDETLERYIPVLMSQAKIYWDSNNYAMVEKIFRKSVEFCSEHDTWKLNVAHVLFMQEAKYKEAISFYEPIIKKHQDDLLSVTAIILANLCVSYIMTSQNEDAEDLMRRIEKEEERVSFDDEKKRTYHLCIVNLVIGTLYCAKGNFEFGIGRVMKSMEPMSKKLGTDTWYYAKRCFCALFETLAKQMIVLKDSVFQDILAFLDSCEANGYDIPAVVDPMGMANMDPAKNSVAYEARLMKSLYLRLYE